MALDEDRVLDVVTNVQVHHDGRGSFFEVCNAARGDDVAQVSVSESRAGTIRGMHASPYAKIVSCLRGRIYDVVVDLRRDSETFLQWHGVWLEEGDGKQVRVPAHCAHGFFAASSSIVLYAQSGAYVEGQDVEFAWNDPAIGIRWPSPPAGMKDYILSAKDAAHPPLNTAVLGRPCECLVFGATGFLGRATLAMLRAQGIEFRVSKARIEYRAQVERDLERFRPQYVICAAGAPAHPNIDWCETHREHTVRVNILGRLNVADVCHARGVGVFVIGTGAMFAGSAGTIAEDAAPTFAGTVYARLMTSLDRIWAEAYPNVLNARVMYPISSSMEEERSMLFKLVRVFPQVHTVPTSYTVIDSLWPLIPDLMRRGVRGTLNFVNPGVTDGNAILAMYKDMVDPSFTWKVAPDDGHRPHGHMDTTRLETLCPAVPRVTEAVRAVLARVARTDAPRALPSAGFAPRVVLVTGCAGFIGSHVTEFWVRRHPEVRFVGFDAIQYNASMRNMNGFMKAPNFDFVRGDICNRELVAHVLSTHRVDAIVHFAAQSHVDFSFGNAVEFTRTNVLGTHTLLDCAHAQGGIQRFVHVSTDEVYGQVADGITCTESALFEPTNPYACSKAAAEFTVRSYVHCYDMPIIIVRCNNVYGPRQFPEKVIPKFVMRLQAGLACCIHGDGTARRAYVHVDDVCEAFDLILRRGIPGEAYNVGSAHEIAVLDLARQLASMVAPGTDREPVEFVEDRAFNDRRYSVDWSKLSALGWTQRVAWEDGLRETVKWYESVDKDYWTNVQAALAPHPRVGSAVVL